MMIDTSALIDKIATDMFEAFAHTFPIACASDEFFYFPQVRLSEPNWNLWDAFCPETVLEFCGKLSSWEDQLEKLNSEHNNLEMQADMAILKKLARTLREQLAEVKTWQYQPTFYLTLACIGLAEALAEENPTAKHDRAKTLSGFLDQASNNLNRVPVLFRDIGLEMVSDTRNYFLFLIKILPELKHALSALDRFENLLKTTPTRDDFKLPADLLVRLIRFHLNCDTELEEIIAMLDQEIREMKLIMNKEVKRLVSNQFFDQNDNQLWLKALNYIPAPAIGSAGLVGLYQGEVNKLAQHCIDRGLISAKLVSSCPVRVTPTPAYLAAIRTASSYSIPPKHPSVGGTFYVNNAEVAGNGNEERLREYRMLSAHETYPGHHLLDTSRWNLNHPIRRVVEQPIFYEGWACFAEELMRLTGYFSNPGDCFLLAKRRLWRAIRGKVDLGLQTGTLNFSTAVEYLRQTGIGTDWAMSSVRKYPLNPGYQLCYTIGIRRFLDLFDDYGHNNLVHFVQMVLNQGEINFIDLEKIFRINHLD